MPHSGVLSLCRPALRWTLFLLLLAGMGIVLEMVLPPQPRWTMPESLFPHGITPDGRAVITTKLKPLENLDDSRPPVQAWDLATGEELACVFPDGFDITDWIKIPADGQDVLIQVQTHQGSPWELHRFDTTRFTTRLVPFPGPDANEFVFDRLGATPFARIRPVGRDRTKPGKQALFDIEAAAILDVGFPREYVADYIVNGPMLCYAKHVGKEMDLIFRDRRKPKAETIRLRYAELYVSGDQKRAVTVSERNPGLLRLKVWDLTTGTPLTEFAAEDGGLHLSEDGAWAMLALEPEEQFDIVGLARFQGRAARSVPDPTDHGLRGVFWNLREGRRVGTCPFVHGDSFEVIEVEGQPRLLTFSYRKSELCLRDLATLESIWTRTWPVLSNLDRPIVRGRSIKNLVSFGNDLEWLDLSNGKTLSTVTLASPRYQAFTPGAPPDTFEVKLSADGRFMTLQSIFFEKEPPPAEAVLALVRAKLGLRPRSTELVQISVVDLEAKTLLMQTMDYSEGLQSWWLSPDGQSLLTNSRRPGRHCVLECWDVPARRPWGWIVAIPLAFGLCSWLGRQAWRRWRAGSGKSAYKAVVNHNSPSAGTECETS